MAERMSDAQTAAPAGHSQPQSPLEPFGGAESWELISAGGVGRIGYSGRYGPTILPVNFMVQDNVIYFRTARHSTMEEDLRTGIANADFKVAFQIDHFDEMAHAGWSVLVQGDVHPMESAEELATASRVGVESWVAGDRDLFMRITPTKITGHRVGQLPG
jgi:nitroimidazol reductase NimA-like FMN-containing flavoprotein (pyridoxamine 5'-phosphate oxidase superfamily)